MTRFAAAVAVLLPMTALAAQKHSDDEVFYEYDVPDVMIESKRLCNEMAYDASVAVFDDERWSAWLMFAGNGDRVYVGSREHHQPNHDLRPGDLATAIANPTVTPVAPKTALFTQETETDQGWQIEARIAPLVKGGKMRSVSERPGPNINHAVAPTPDGGVWIVWQGADDGRFKIFGRKATLKDNKFELTDTVTIAEAAGSCWHPDVSVSSDGTFFVVWDAYDGDSYNVYARINYDGDWGEVITVASTDAFEGRAKVAAAPDGEAWICWEIGGKNWGKPYTSEMKLAGQESVKMTDLQGPLHRFREIKLAKIHFIGRMHTPSDALPMISLQNAVARENLRPHVGKFGAFYERGELAVDGKGRLWIAYRHFYAPWLTVKHISHKESGWGVYARCFTDQGWSKLYKFDVGQGDGMQRLSIAPIDDGITAMWTTGRTDRRENTKPRGVFTATISLDEGNAPTQAQLIRRITGLDEPPVATAHTLEPITRDIRGKTHYLVHGDLHRHTDLSLCFSPIDGTLDDVYRYAIDVVRHDFLGVTDHSRDIAKGDALSQLWHRTVNAATRHDLSPTFIPFFSYERSIGGEDHNVISLRRDLLRPHTYPHAEFWKELDNDTITIPHQTMTPEITEPPLLPFGITKASWKVRDDVHRPLLEIYQGCRHRAITRDANYALDNGQRLGFIASSDHLATSHSYAYVWTPDRSRESIFRAMQARRTFGATAKIQLLVTAGETVMGESLTATSVPPINIHAAAAAPIAMINVIIDGKVSESLNCDGKTQTDLTFNAPELSPGTHYLYVELHQRDGHRAWSSPIWIDIE